jgi:Flp pilus assembly pilin Flp
MKSLINKTNKNRRGVTTLEYVIMALCVGCAITVAAFAFKDKLANAFNSAGNHVDTTMSTAKVTSASSSK